MMKILIIFLQMAVFILVSPLLSGIIAKIKNNIRMRKGQSVFQPYYNLIKLFSKGEVVSENCSWIFRAAPFVYIASCLTAALLIPVFMFSPPLNYMGDFLALIFIFALGRFFLALAALDSASAFGGMGASREMFISSLVEPVLLLAVFSISLRFGSTNIASSSGIHALSVSSIAAVIALFLVVLAETSRIPVDNQETHLELTMIHEAMFLEYSGRPLALIEMSSYIKQMVWFLLIARIIFPVSAVCLDSPAGLLFWFCVYSGRVVVIAVVIALVETSLAKMRLFRAPDFLAFGFVLAVTALICALLGV